MNLVATMRAYAQDHYYQNSWDVLLAWTDAQIEAAIAGAKTRRGAIAKAWKHIRAIDANRPADVYGAKPRKAVSLFQYLAAQGGLAPHPELRAILDGNPWIGGHGPLVRQRGMELDEARRVAVEGHYLPDTAWAAGCSASTVREFLDAVSDEARGLKCYPFGERGEDLAEFIEDEPANEEAYDDVPF